MTPEDVGGSLVDTSMTLGTAYIGGKLMQWMGEKWIPLNKNEVNAGNGDYINSNGNVIGNIGDYLK